MLNLQRNMEVYKIPVEDETVVNASLSVIIPCYNEIATISEIIDRVRQVPIEDIEIIVVDNGSTDGTRELLSNELKGKINQLYFNERNIGKSGSVCKGIAHATKDMVVVQDADLEYDPRDSYVLLLQTLIDEKVDAVYGSRFRDKKNAKGNWKNFYANKLLTMLSNCMTGYKLTDMETCYKMFRREVIQSIELVESGFCFEPEVTAKLAAGGYKVNEISISYYPRTSEEGKKVRFSDGIDALKTIWKYRKG